jgi:hypothetical protein
VWGKWLPPEGVKEHICPSGTFSEKTCPAAGYREIMLRVKTFIGEKPLARLFSSILRGGRYVRIFWKDVAYRSCEAEILYRKL